MKTKNVKIMTGFLMLTLLLVLTTPFKNLMAIGKFQDYPKDGIFKQLPANRDKWYYFDDKNWYIKAPDKFQHMMGSYTLYKISDMLMDKYLAGGVVLGLGIYKEYDDGLREGWSPRDLLMNTVGVVAGMINSDKYKFWMDWEQDCIILKFSVSFK